MNTEINNRWAFFKDQPDGQWMVVIVGHTERCPPDSGRAEVLDYCLFTTHKDAFAWANKEIGPLARVDN